MSVEIKKIPLLLAIFGMIGVLSTAGCVANVSNPALTPSPTSSPLKANSSYIPPTFPGYLNYTNKSAGVAMQYPASWIGTEGRFDSVAGFTSPDPAAYLLVNMKDSPKSTVSDYAYGEYIKELKSSRDFKTWLNSSNSTLAGYPARVITYIVNNNETISAKLTGTPTTLKVMEIWTWKNQMEYKILYGGEPEAYESHLESAQKMMQSFSIIG